MYIYIYIYQVVLLDGIDRFLLLDLLNAELPVDWRDCDQRSPTSLGVLVERKCAKD